MSVRETTVLFDGITAFILAVIPLYFIELRRRVRAYKITDPAPYYLLACLLGALWLTIFYGSFIEPKLLTTKAYDVALGDTGGRLKIAVVSDTHLGVFEQREWLNKIADRVNALRPDLVILDGDLVVNLAGLDSLEPLSRLKSRLGNYAALGNFDYRVGAVDVRRRVESYGVEVLTNESVPLSGAGGRRSVRLIGLDDLWFGDPDWDKALADVRPGDLKILVGHNPDFAPKAEASGVDLLISGHTHGGQIRLPLIGPLTRLPITIGQRFDRGLFDFGKLQLFISSGTGESGTRARLFCPPEISLLNVSF